MKKFNVTDRRGYHVSSSLRGPQQRQNKLDFDLILTAESDMWTFFQFFIIIIIMFMNYSY